MSRLSLAITDLAPPEAGARLPRLPALERLLARGRRDGAIPGFRHWVLSQVGLEPPRRLPLASVVAGRPGAFALATPVHLIAGLDRVHLHPAGLRDLDMDELAAIAASFNEHLGEDRLALEALSGSLALLSLPRPLDCDTHDPAELAGREAGAWLPSGPDGGWLRRLMTEAQMLLHDHPVNAARAARGALAANGLWLWGCGGDALPGPARPLPPLASSDAFLAALWRSHGAGVSPMPSSVSAWLEASGAGGGSATLELFDPGLTVEESLARAEALWFAPLERALAAGRIGELALWLGGGAVRCRPRDRLRFWRRGAPWHEAIA